MNHKSRGASAMRATGFASLAALVTLFSIAAVLSARSAGLLQPLELWVSDRVVAATAADVPIRDVILVPVQEQDLQAWGWPLPDARIAAIIAALGKAGAVAVGVDIYRDRSIPPGAADLERAFSTVNAVAISNLGAEGSPAIAPPAIAKSLGHYGFSDMPLDPDGVVRRALLLVSNDAGLEISFGLRLAQLAQGDAPLAAWPDDPTILAFGGQPVPPLQRGFGPYVRLDDAGYQALVSYRNRVPIARVIPARDVLSGAADVAAIRGKVAIVGTAADTVKDDFRTPLNDASAPATTYGIALHAAVVQQILDYTRGTLSPDRSLPAWAVTALICATGLAGSLVAARTRSFLTAALFGPVAGLMLGSALAMALSAGWWLPAVPAMMAYLLSFALMFSILASLARKQQRQVLQLFSGHLSPELARQIWDNRDVILSGGRPEPRRLFATVLFADLVGSTKVGGSAEPRAYMDWISRYLARMSEVAQAHGGFVEKYTGDGIMVVFGAPVPSLTAQEHRRDAEAACVCSLAMKEAIQQLNAAAGNLAPYRIRIGLHSGEVLGGTIGTTGSLRYNIIGDAANVASRVETFGKRVGAGEAREATICMTRQTAELSSPIVEVVPAGTLAHDDARTRLEIFELVGCARI